MAFALTSCFLDGTKFQGPGLHRAIQNCVLTITGTAADVALDIGDYSGTFWTAALADATYGTMALQVKTALQAVTAQCTCVSALPYIPEINQAVGSYQGGSPSTDVYTLAVSATTLLPSYTFTAARGYLAYTVFVNWYLAKNILPTNSSYNL